MAAPRGRDHDRIGPFLATFSPATDNPYLNYAIPDDDSTPSEDDVPALVEAYRRRERKPRLEYVPSLAPAVEPALLAAGFKVEGRLPLMTYADGPDAPAPDGIELLEARSEEDLRGVASVQWEAYGESGPLPQRAVDGLCRTAEAGGLIVLAREAATHELAGGGLCTGPYERATELTSIGVRESFRRRGIAEAMTRWLAREMHARGSDAVFLMAAGEREARIYERAGFKTVSEILHISLAT